MAAPLGGAGILQIREGDCTRESGVNGHNLKKGV